MCMYVHVCVHACTCTDHHYSEIPICNFVYSKLICSSQIQYSAFEVICRHVQSSQKFELLLHMFPNNNKQG